ncbi:glycosyltransferase [Tamilnaduibacter salinus]|uniref:Glycosyltransferase n=1 Tax=Tamilnaduibacter salinus TaxID=1484056 RepID=A0A2A2I5N5_9GAMM|nr:glycosyltransferase [Tamilnaduibacter salinus]PAV27039.1 glycosyltransferase [Tamilnaduibacter salinus]
MEEHIRPIRILHVTFNMGFGGTEQVIRQLVQNLPADAYRNEIVCIDGFVGEMGQQLQSEGVTVQTLPRGQGLDVRLAGKLRRIIRRGGIDIVHCHQYTPFFYGWLASLGLSAQVVFTEHGRFHPDRYRYKARWINPLMARLTPALVAISQATREALVEYEFMPRCRIDVIYNGIQGFDPDAAGAAELRRELGIPASDTVLGTVSRLDPVKNQRMMLEAFQQFHQQHPDSWLLLVGDGPDRSRLEAYARELAVSDQVVFTGFQSRPSTYLQAMDVFLLSSHTEGTSMTLLEAMSLGIPPVVTDVGGNPEIVTHRQDGMLVPTEDPERMAQALEDIVSDPAFQQSLSATAKQTFNHRFSVEVMTDAYRRCYQRCLGR